MDKRTLLALVLMALVIVVTPMVFPSSPQRAPAPKPDSSGAAATATTAPTPVASPPTSAVAGRGVATDSSRLRHSAPAETTVVAGSRVRYLMRSAGATPQAVQLDSFRDLRPGRHDTLTISQPIGALLGYRLAFPGDTVALDTVPFTVARTGDQVVFTSGALATSITYSLAGDGYLTHVEGKVNRAGSAGTLLVDLPHQFRSSEADTLDDARHFAFGYRIHLRDVTSVPFSKLDVGQTRVDTGAFDWVSVRNKYFLVALLKSKAAGGTAFRGIAMTGGPRAGRVAPEAFATTALPLTNGTFAFDLYVGPISWQELHAIGDDLENVNPYAGFFHAVVQPFATIVIRILLWLKATLRLNYGWVLVLFGLIVRIALWPLNQRAMKTSIQMQRLQPELQEVQSRYKNDPDKQRDALVKLYQAHGMSPFSPLMGCLPMLLPMPVLFALYFVFQNTIEFRGVPFLWLPDLSLSDPLFITPLIMGASMFLLSWIGMKNAPPNPQTKMMSYVMPAMFTVMFLRFASGLNLYYAVQNIAAFPQQWLLSRQRQQSATAKK